MVRILGLLGGGQKKDFARDPIFGGSYMLKPLPLEDSNYSLQCHKQPERKRAKIRGQ